MSDANDQIRKEPRKVAMKGRLMVGHEVLLTWTDSGLDRLFIQHSFPGGSTYYCLSRDQLGHLIAGLQRAHCAMEDE